jgi:hypothetical protein
VLRFRKSHKDEKAKQQEAAAALPQKAFLPSRSLFR